jgi:beta-glucosidase
MTSYNSLNGSPCTASDWLLNTKLKQDMGFRGFCISDACAVGGANVLHYTAADYPDASAKAIMNGLDVILQTSYDHYTLFIPPFLDGTIPPAIIDSAVARVLRVKFGLGLFDHPWADTSGIQSYDPATTKRLAREAACKSVVLLKNEKELLPLHKTLKKLAVIGTDAVEGRLGGYSGKGNGIVTILDGIRQKAGPGCEVTYAPGCGRQSPEWTVVPDTCLFHATGGKPSPGLSGEYFNNTTLSGEPVLTRTDPRLDFRWTLYSPDPAVNYDFFSVRWTGKLRAPASGRFSIGLEGNERYRLYLGGKLLIDRNLPSYGLSMAGFDFEAGKEYDLRVEFAESSGSVWLKLVWDLGLPDGWNDRISEAVAAAKQSDAAVVVVGIDEGEGQDRASLALPGHQEELIRRVAETGKPVVVVLVGGSAITMKNWMDYAGAILDVWYPGEEGGNAVADVLFGDFNPAGRLPVTFPVAEGQLPLVYNHKPTGRNDDYRDLTGKPLFPFGYGLSYTSFEYGNLAFGKTSVAPGDSTLVSLTVKNTGTQGGDEVVQLYIRDLLSSVARPLKELKGFQRISLRSGEEKKVTFTITPVMLEMLNAKLERVTEPGDFRIMIGASSADIRLRGTLTLNP